MKLQQLLWAVLCCLLLPNFANAQSQKMMGNPGSKDNEINLLSERMREHALAEDPLTEVPSYPINGKWADINYKAVSTSAWESGGHWDRLIVLSKLFVNKFSSGETDEKLLNAIVAAIDFWQQEKPVCSNYWWNAIGVPVRMGEVLLLMGDHLPARSINTVIPFMRLGIRENHYEYYGVATGQNQVWLAQVHAMIGIVEKDTNALRRAFTAIHQEVYLSTGEGIQYDYSFFQHGHQLYSGGYGMGYTKDIARFIKLTHGTSYQFPEDKIAIFSSFVLEGQRWMIYKDVFDYSTMGREISREKGADGRAAIIAEVCNTMASLDIPKKNAFRNMADEINGVSKSTLFGNKHFWRGDMMIHRTPKFYTSIKVTSSRIKSSEWGNSENEKSFYLGQGVQLVMHNGKEYRQIFPVWDWQKLPGTLAEQRDTLPKTSGPWGDGAFGKKPFTGGVSNGIIGFAVNDYALENVSARRAWFCFNNEVVVMGAAVVSTSKDMLLQTVNQSYQQGEVFVKIGAANQPGVSVSHQSYQLNEAGWVLHDSTAYFFPSGQKVTIKAGKQKGSWSLINGGVDAPQAIIEKDVFNVWINLGRQVNNSSFSYTIVPGISKEAAHTYQLPYQVISNNKQQQVVADRKEKAWMAAFYEAGSFTDKEQQLQLTSDQPVLVLVREAGASYEVSLSNPLNKAATVKLFINRKLKGEGCTWLDTKKMTEVSVVLPSGNYAGQSVTRTYLLVK